MRGALEFLSFLNPVSWFTEQDVYQPLQPPQCQLGAWVRAQDLHPNATSLGEVRVKLFPPCNASISSLALELRLEETLRDDRRLGTTRSLEEVARIAWTTNLDLLASDELPTDHSFLDGVVFPFNVVTPNVNYPAGTNVAFSATSSQNGNSFFNTHARYLYKVTAGFTDGSSRESRPTAWTTFHPCRPEVLDTSPTQIQTIATSLSRVRQRWDGIPQQGRRVAGAVNVTVTFPRGAVIEQGGLLEMNVSLIDARDMELPAVQVVVRPSLLQNVNIPSPEQASFFTAPGVTLPQELRAAIRPPFPKDTLGQSLPRSVNLRLPQESDLGPVPPELSNAQFLLRADELLPGGFRGTWSTPSTVVHLRLEVGPETASSRRDIYGIGTAAFCDLDGGWEVGGCDTYPAKPGVVTFVADVPVAVVHRACIVGAEPPIHYLDNGGLNPRPILIKGHATPAEVVLPLASPRLETRAKKLIEDYEPTCTLGQQDDYFYDVEMHFAGTLWERSRLIGEQQPKPQRNDTETDSPPYIDFDEDYADLYDMI